MESKEIVRHTRFFITFWYGNYGGCLQVDGSFPVDLDMLKSLVSAGTMLLIGS